MVLSKFQGSGFPPSSVPADRAEALAKADRFGFKVPVPGGEIMPRRFALRNSGFAEFTKMSHNSVFRALISVIRTSQGVVDCATPSPLRRWPAVW
jgi:hypothetical protein